MALPLARRFPLMAITQQGSSRPHAEQAERLCAAGVRWIQLRMKEAPRDLWLEQARAVAQTCRAHGAVCIINDSVDLALEAGADGVHLGRTDLDWTEARRRLGPGRILGGTVNYPHEAEKAVRAGCMDYVGVGPLRFTRTKQELAPLQGFDGIANLISILDGIPAWAIGGIETADLPRLHALGAAGAAVCSAFWRDGAVDRNVADFLAAWPGKAAAA
ncbi:MAG TPA: thiamine phosphate synthase [Opitutaceae bacterium]|nr:thiamine phosphate synthase [Opitutaceae bacterium]